MYMNVKKQGEHFESKMSCFLCIDFFIGTHSPTCICTCLYVCVHAHSLLHTYIIGEGSGGATGARAPPTFCLCAIAKALMVLCAHAHAECAPPIKMLFLRHCTCTCTCDTWHSVFYNIMDEHIVLHMCTLYIHVHLHQVDSSRFHWLRRCTCRLL